jgi:hypothetical protein
MDIRGKFLDGFFLLSCSNFLGLKIYIKLIDFGLFFGKLLSKLIHFSHLFFKNFFQI